MCFSLIFFRFNNNNFLLSQLISLVKKDSQEKDFNIVNLYTCRISTNRPTLTAFFLELLIKQVGKWPMPYNRNRIAFLHCLSRKLKHWVTLNCVLTQVMTKSCHLQTKNVFIWYVFFIFLLQFLTHHFCQVCCSKMFNNPTDKTTFFSKRNEVSSKSLYFSWFTLSNVRICCDKLQGRQRNIHLAV